MIETCQVKWDGNENDAEKEVGNIREAVELSKEEGVVFHGDKSKFLKHSISNCHRQSHRPPPHHRHLLSLITRTQQRRRFFVERNYSFGYSRGDETVMRDRLLFIESVSGTKDGDFI